jgi:hypothetical protein
VTGSFFLIGKAMVFYVFKKQHIKINLYEKQIAKFSLKKRAPLEQSSLIF